MSLDDLPHDEQLRRLYAMHQANPRPLSEQWIRLVLRRAFAIRCNEAAILLPKTDIGYRQFECRDVDGRYVDSPIVTLYENGTWERV